MLRVYGVLIGFAVFGAVFASVYYEPDNELTTTNHPTFRFGPGDSIVDFVDPRGVGNVTVNVTVLEGGPVSIHVMHVEALEPLVDVNNSTITLRGPLNYSEELSDLFVEKGHDLRIVSDGETRWAVVVTDLGTLNESLSIEEQVTAVKVQIRHIERESKELLMGYLMAFPSVALVGYTLFRYKRRNGKPPMNATVSLGD